ncbi:hypothetical protein KY336_03830 [Candidatus Woesearchaeota archaeon]|nr:hypothetical protein [Candidatus Woesearchaeota archaeon]
MRTINLLESISKGHVIDMRAHDPDSPEKFTFIENFKRMRMIKVFLNSPMLNVIKSDSSSDSYDWIIRMPVFGSEFRARINSKGDVRSPGSDFYGFWQSYNNLPKDYDKEKILKKVRDYPAMRFSGYLQSHPVTLAYFIGATQGIDARIPDERINPFAAKEKDKEIPEKDLELALLSGALFSTMTEEEMDKFFERLKEMMLYGDGGFRAGALGRYINHYDGCMAPKKSKTLLFKREGFSMDEMMGTDRYQLYESELFKTVINYLDLQV